MMKKTSNNFTFRTEEGIREKLDFIAKNHMRTPASIINILINEAYEVESQPGYIPAEIAILRRIAPQVVENIKKQSPA
jgi:hypothetical protein